MNQAIYCCYRIPFATTIRQINNQQRKNFLISKWKLWKHCQSARQPLTLSQRNVIGKFETTNGSIVWNGKQFLSSAVPVIKRAHLVQIEFMSRMEKYWICMCVILVDGCTIIHNTANSHSAYGMMMLIIVYDGCIDAIRSLCFRFGLFAWLIFQLTLSQRNLL